MPKKKKDYLVLSRETIIRLRVLCKLSAMAHEKPGSKGIIVPLEYTPRMKRLLKMGYRLIDKRPAQYLLMKNFGMIKSFPKGKALDLMPDWAIFIFERKA